jgi:hypothetical protein
MRSRCIRTLRPSDVPAQCLERERAIFLACIYAPIHSHRRAYDERHGENFTLTFGNLAKRYLDVATAEHSNLAHRVQSVVELRNEIAHRYFWNRAVELTRSDGRQAMIHELMDACNTFDALDGELTRLNMAWSTERVSPRRIEKWHLLTSSREKHLLKKLG